MPGEKNKTFVLRIDAQTMEALEAWAEDEFRSINGQLQWIIADALRRSGRLKRPRAAASGTSSPESAAPESAAPKPAGTKPAGAKPAGTKPAGTKPAAANSAGRRTEKEPAGASSSSKSLRKESDEASSAPASAEPKNQKSL